MRCARFISRDLVAVGRSVGQSVRYTVFGSCVRVSKRKNQEIYIHLDATVEVKAVGVHSLFFDGFVTGTLSWFTD